MGTKGKSRNLLGAVKKTCRQCVVSLKPKTWHISAHNHLVIDDDFTTVKPTTNAVAIKRWQGLIKQQPNARTMLNQLPQIEDTFNMTQNPELHVMDLMSKGNTIHPHVPHVTETTPRIDGKNKPGRLNKNVKT